MYHVDSLVERKAFQGSRGLNDDRWHEQLWKAMRCQVAVEHQEGPFTLEAGMDLGLVRLEVKRLRPLTLTRPLEPPPLLEHEVVQVVALLRGTLRVVWGGRHSEMGVGDLYAHDFARIRELTIPGGGEPEPVVMALATIPKPLLPMSAGQMDAVLGRGLPAADGVGAVLYGFLRDLAEARRALSPSDGLRLGMVLIDLVSAFFSATVETDPMPLPGAGRQALTVSIQTFVLQNLDDPELTPHSIAAAHHISVSYLHRLFQDRGETVSAWIRNHRLRRARRDLADPALATVPIHVIASRWGFSHSSAFSRAFRIAYGVSPRDFRAQVLSRAINESLRTSAMDDLDL
ncbi:helix-turn-helix domain-containing protein [Nonomuraea purpurea]|uniref:Helix-turn-helix domain-containing protein n=1 Tax=Nonomuraea purpurea TaxID=1849276 RepID=A0ABV8G791_9ACTN